MERARWSSRERVLDGAVLLVTACVALVVPLWLPDGRPAHGPLAGTAGFVVVGCVLAATTRLRLDARFGLVGVVVAGMAGWALLAPGAVATASDPTNLLMPLAPAFVLHAGHRYAQDQRWTWGVTGVLTVVAVHPWSTTVPTAAGGLVYVAAPMLFGCYLAARAQLVRTLTERAEEAERERDLQAGRSRTEERLRLAVELHDTVTHRVSLMVLHAGALRVTAADDTTRDTAEHVRATGCDALVELRDLIGVLRSRPSGAPAPEVPGPPVAPRPPRIGRADLRAAAIAVLVTVALSALAASWNPADAAMRLVVPWAEIAIQLPVAAAFVLRRRHPHLVVLAVTALALASVAAAPGELLTSDVPLLLVPAVTPLATYAVGAYSRRPVVGTALVLGLVTLAARPWAPHLPVITAAAAFVGVPALLGLSVGARRRVLAALTERAERACRARALLADRARADERARLGEEMHGIVAGRVRDMMARATELAPAEAATELVANGQRALDELTGLVGALRTDQVPVTGQLAGLAWLAEESAAVGVPVDLVEEGNPAAVSPTVARTTHRIVGEALTNVRKHAHGASVRVRVRYSVECVRVEIRNDRPPPGPRGGDPDLAAGGSGTGLLGVRHRVELVDGTLRAGPTAAGGFTVDATLPAYVPTSTSVGERSR
ncbi:ATP-binding protein [Actinophytocola algeriensis]|uniref:histidine kinase n=1 Tax=Actinophytocola algeriensis TaxID=1768010 RepID=A0A7W7Q393_9PSEU|nr:histidine kinase [Actinophytocola algeriensis]MBB4905899.1 signal transduction histidine kinase [Actinophytocola algeriensis]MBE1472416.1 signal transduction histidine kinase [Actinophytocola algeriensis]